MKNVLKVLLLGSLVLSPLTTVDADDVPKQNVSEVKESMESVEVEGKTYYDTGYAGTVRGLADDNYDGHLDIKTANGDYVRYKKGKDPETILVSRDFYTRIYATKDFPKDKIPADVYSATYLVNDIDDEHVHLTYISGGNDDIEILENSDYLAKISYFKDKVPEKGEKVKLWHWYPTNGYEELMIPEVYKVEFVKAVGDTEKEDENANSNNDLADNLFENLVLNNASKILLEQSPQTVKSIEGKLKKLISESEELIEQGYEALLTEQESSENDNTKAVIKIIEEKYNIQLETDVDIELALKLYENMVASKSAKLLIDLTPKTIEKIKPKLEELIESSDQIVTETLPVLQ